MKVPSVTLDGSTYVPRLRSVITAARRDSLDIALRRIDDPYPDDGVRLIPAIDPRSAISLVAEEVLSCPYDRPYLSTALDFRFILRGRHGNNGNRKLARGG
jgi:hypothetical protein